MKTKKKKIIIIVLSALIIIFLLLSSVWLIRYNTIIKPLYQRNQDILQKTDDTGMTDIYEYNDANMEYLVSLPHFLYFYGNISCANNIEIDENNNFLIDYNYSFSFSPKVLGTEYYQFNIWDYRNCKKVSDEPIEYYFRTDKDFNLIEAQSIADYEEYKEDIMTFFNEKVVSFYGKEVFK